MYGILFLFSFCLRFCWYVACWGPGFPLAYGTYHLFYGLYLYLFENLSLFFLFLSFMGLMTSSYFYLLMEPSALLAVLHVYSLHWLFIAFPIYGVLKIFCKAANVVAWILQIRFFLLGPSVLQS